MEEEGMPRAADVVDGLLARGQSAVTTAEAAQLLDVPPEQVRVRLHRLVRTGHLFSPSRGLWVAVPPEFRSWGVVPGLHFLDAMMHHLGRDYYVGWLSAAELHGAAHQRPQVLQVAVDRHLPDRDVARVRLRFAERSHLAEVPRRRRNVPTGQVWVSTPEATTLDLAADPVRGGGVSNVATVLADLADEQRLDPGRLAAAAERFGLPAVRRLGYLFDAVDLGVLAEALHPLADARRATSPDLLAPERAVTGDVPVDARWRVRVNTPVEPDR
jgi:predicted transcriptional regulator of viral defense system